MKKMVNEAEALCRRVSVMECVLLLNDGGEGSLLICSLRPVPTLQRFVSLLL